MTDENKIRDIDRARETIRRPIRIDPKTVAAINLRNITHKIRQDFKAACAKSGISVHHALREYVEMCIQKGEVLTMLYYDMIMEIKTLKAQIEELQQQIDDDSIPDL
jgi:hypothetical protein